jgi:hypothetical protein
MSNIYLTSNAARFRSGQERAVGPARASLLEQAPFALGVLAVLALAWLA